ncbi:MAG: tetratricopeptide repeat protein [Fusobacteria bacterium]|nr:tetratricopeptide repeat protein [Fusobacteriota bacterium]
MYILFAFVLILGMFIFFIYMYFSRESIIAEAILQYENGDLEKALENFKNYSVVKPYDIRSKKYLAKIHFEFLDYMLALKECVSITVSKFATLREKSDAFALMSEIYIAQEIYDKAAKMAIEGFRLEPKNPKIHMQLGNIYMLTDKKEKAITEYNMVLNTDRMNQEARFNLAKIHELKGDKVKAVFQYKKILEINPNNETARFSLGKLLYKDGNIKEAVDELLKLNESEFKEDILEYYFMLSNYYLKTKENETAKKYLEKAVFSIDKKDDKVTFMQYELALLYEEEENLDEAYRLYEEIRVNIPRYRDVDLRMKKLKKILFPEEHAKIIESIDYNSLTMNDLEDLFKKIVDKLGYKEFRNLQKNRNRILIIAVEKFKTALQGRFLIQILRNFDPVDAVEIEKLKTRMEEEKCVRAINLTTATYTEEALIFSNEEENIELLDKVSIFELIGN